MDISRLSFDTGQPDEGAPTAPSVGVAIAVAPDPSGEAGRVVVYGACRVPRASAPAQHIDLPRGVFLTAVEAAEQRPFTVPLVGDRLVFEGDIGVVGDDYLIEFHCSLSTATSMTGPYYLHASFFGHISDVIRVEP